ncbi:MAG: class II aldolase/adducin family protein [Chloroflexi bacterium]|nr:class II aldolase/adducin family protein [Chloroflexota bacterium]
MTSTTVDLKREVAIANRVLWATGLCTGVTASLGHASLRMTDRPDRFLVKGRGDAMDALAAMRPEDMVTCDLDGNLVDGPPGATQCFEIKMHSWIYKLYPDVQSVVHVHPRYTVLMSTLGRQLKPMCQEGIQLVARPLPMYPHVKTVVTDAEGEEVARLIDGSKAVLLQGHGATTTGANLEEAVSNMLHLEEQARMNYQALCALGPDYPSLPQELIDEMSNRPAYSELPHFRDVFARRDGQPRVGGLWQYYTQLVAKDL